MHWEMLAAMKFRHFPRFKELDRDADASVRRRGNRFELIWQARQRERGGESNKKERCHPVWIRKDFRKLSTLSA
jgi:hypothetical protein